MQLILNTNTILISLITSNNANSNASKNYTLKREMKYVSINMKNKLVLNQEMGN